MIRKLWFRSWSCLQQHAPQLQAVAAIVVILGAIASLIAFLAPDLWPTRTPPDSTNLVREICFRITQADKLLKNAVESRDDAIALSDEELQNIISNDRLSLSGQKLQRLYRAAPQLKVVAELGGISSAPRTDDEASVWVGGSGWQNSHLPSGRGYRSEEFKDYSLPELWEELYKLNTGEAPHRDNLSRVRDIFVTFLDVTEPSETVTRLPGIAANGYTMRIWSEKLRPDTIKVTTLEVAQWLNPIVDAWKTIKLELPSCV